jgi:sulfate transport system ATP-binding protein
MSISIRNVTKRFKRFTALDGVDLEIPHGELVALLGPSGSGKTTLLRIIAGLERPDSGTVLFSGADATRTSLRERRVGFVFQHYALFRHMTIFANVAFGLTARPRAERPPAERIRERVMHLLKMVQLEWCADRYPHQLSGGQRQRIALARALAVEPHVLLLDEPFGALDAQVRTELRRWLRRLHDEMGVTSVFVTHDQEEAMEVSDRVVVIHHGRVEQQGTPREVYERPATPFVFQFIGHANRFPVRVHQGRAEIAGVWVDVPEHATAEDAAGVAFARPHELLVGRAAGPGALPAVVRRIHAVGPLPRLELAASRGGVVFEAQLSSDALSALAPSLGETVQVAPRAVRVFLDPQATEPRSSRVCPALPSGNG